MCTGEPQAVAGCVDCLELVVEDLEDRDCHEGTCLHCREKISANGGVEWRRAVRRPCPTLRQAGLVGSRAVKEIPREETLWYPS